VIGSARSRKAFFASKLVEDMPERRVLLPFA